MQRLLIKATLFVALFALVLSSLPTSVFAAPKTMISTTGDAYETVSTGSYGHDNTGTPTGRYRFYMGHWNPSSNGPMEVVYDTAAPSFSVTKFQDVTLPGSNKLDFTKSASVYDENSGFSTAEGEDVLTSGHFHAPAAYPSLYKGCHWADCSVGNGGPFPVKVSQLESLKSTWEIGVTAPAETGVWNASYDIWFDTNARGFMPGNPTGLTYSTDNLQGGQNDGAEVMIWLNNRGYSATGNPITPAGKIIASNVLINGKRYDVWFGRLQAPFNPNTPVPQVVTEYPAWNVVSYVALDRALVMEDLDTNLFIQDATTRQCDTAPGGICLSPDWWITSVQSGFEIWADGVGLSTKRFEVTPKVKSGPTDKVVTGRNGPDGTPLIHWDLPFNLRTTGCNGGTATYTIASEVGDTGLFVNKPMAEIQPGEYFASVPKLNPMHGTTKITMKIACPDGTTQTEVINVYIDPSGLVRTPQGNGIPGATMTLFRADSPNGPFVQVPNGSTIMAPYNRRNPDKTGTMGDFGWDVIAGYYKVRAEKAGCVSAANPAQSYVESAVLTIPPAVTNLDLRLTCASANGGLSVKLITTNDWGAGYCVDLKVTNTGAATVPVWQVSFSAVGTIYTSWNAAFSKVGNTVTARGQGWNAALAPGQTTHSVGFCANR
jgi:hypothetical protein